MKYRYSIIIPFYNAEKYIERNLESVKTNIRDDIEVIIINDGSTDKTLELVNKFPLNNKKVISIKNGGVSNARNVGLKHSNGEYVLFLDGDDGIDKNLIKTVDQYYDDKFDLIKFGIKVIKENNQFDKKITKTNTIIKDNQVYINELIATRSYNSASNQMVKRELLIRNNIVFDCNKKYAEDYQFNIDLLKKVDSILLLENCLYHYYKHSDSTTNNLEKQNVIKCTNDAIDVYIKSLDYYKDDEKSNIKYIDCLKRVEEEICLCIKKILLVNNSSAKEKKQIIKNVLNNKKIIKLYSTLKEYNYTTSSVFEKLVYNRKIENYVCILNLLIKIKRIWRKK